MGHEILRRLPVRSLSPEREFDARRTRTARAGSGVRDGSPRHARGGRVLDSGIRRKWRTGRLSLVRQEEPSARREDRPSRRLLADTGGHEAVLVAGRSREHESESRRGRSSAPRVCQTRASRRRRASGGARGSAGAPAFSRDQGGVDVRPASLRAPLRRPSREQSHDPALRGQQGGADGEFGSPSAVLCRQLGSEQYAGVQIPARCSKRAVGSLCALAFGSVWSAGPETPRLVVIRRVQV